MPTSISRRLAVTGTVAISLALAGCGTNSLGGSGSSGNSSSTSVSIKAGGPDKKAEALVPANIKSKGTLVIGSDASYAPNEYLPVGSSTITGMDVDMFNAVAGKLGLKTKWQDAQFTTIIPGLGTKFDVGVSSFTINKQREASVNMISYLTAGVQWAVQKGNPKKIDPAKPCGLNVGVQTGTTEASELDALNKGTCKSKPIHIVPETDQTKVNLDLQSGKVDAMTADSPITQYAVKQSSGKLELVGQVTESAPYGFVVPKSETQFGKAIVAALQAIKADGTYDQILKKWGLSGGVNTFALNPKVSS